MAVSVTWPQPNWAHFPLTGDKSEGRKSHKQAAAGGLAKYGGTSAFLIFQTSDSPVLKIFFIIILVCPITFESVKIDGLCRKQYFY